MSKKGDKKDTLSIVQIMKDYPRIKKMNKNFKVRRLWNPKFRT